MSRTGLSLAVPVRSQNGLRYSRLEKKESLIVLAPAWAPARPTPRPTPQSVSCRARALSYNFCPGPVDSLGPATRFSVHHGSVHEPSPDRRSNVMIPIDASAEKSVIETLQRTGHCSLDDLVMQLPNLNWNVVFVALVLVIIISLYSKEGPRCSA